MSDQDCARCPRLGSRQINDCALVAAQRHLSLADVIQVWLDERDANHDKTHVTPASAVTSTAKRPTSANGVGRRSNQRCVEGTARKEQ